MLTTISLQIDDSILHSLRLDKLEFSKELLYNNALLLYRKNKLSLGKAAEMAGLDRIDFIHKLQFDGDVVFDYPIEYANEMVELANRFLEKQ